MGFNARANEQSNSSKRTSAHPAAKYDRDAERMLWKMLRGSQMGGLKFRRQHPFGDYVLDFACLEKKIVIEIDGGQHQECMTEDGVRTKTLESSGFRVLRFWNHEVLQQPEAVVERIWQEVIGKKDPSSPLPSP